MYLEYILVYFMIFRLTYFSVYILVTAETKAQNEFFLVLKSRS
jgi:hypothetical protein